MPKETVLTELRYAKLLADVRRLIEEGKARATRAAGQELLRTYWEIGKRVCEEKLTQNAGYNRSILADLSEELEIDDTTLLRCIHFFQTYNPATSSRNLTWSHYKYLLPINDEEERKWYENLAAGSGLNVAQLSKVIKDDRYGQSLKNKGKKITSGKLRRPTEATYVYKAVVERVIDGDTLLLRIDLGFQVWKAQRLRLAGIDAPAMDDPKGREAYRSVLNQLAKVDFVMVKTNKIDVYGRYVGDVFYSTKAQSKEKIFSDGFYLNQDLVGRGLARIL
ncbi:MAG: thermonuclease family protein [Candidatus Omnitrophica bacterium]|nr:thermonuclease family protein [Candidatus Omnitrophota bacterium]